ncbi:hypothetical protein [Tenacibaculum sp. Ill]|uniref:hypothetical protein n=1 Tax=Tenacibaculum sp. Ill TaxID=3445935 RepID=UPI003F7A0AEE
MKKSILNLGKALNKADQKQINGGNDGPCGELGGTIFYDRTKESCRLVHEIWYEGHCWACYE